MEKDNGYGTDVELERRSLMPVVPNKRADKIPADAVYVGRPTKWGNPFKVGSWGIVPHMGRVDQAEAVRLYKEWLWQRPDLVEQAKSGLKGKDLVCWCAPLPCHADVLLELANKEVKQRA